MSSQNKLPEFQTTMQNKTYLAKYQENLLKQILSKYPTPTLRCFLFFFFTNKSSLSKNTFYKLQRIKVVLVSEIRHYKISLKTNFYSYLLLIFVVNKLLWPSRFGYFIQIIQITQNIEIIFLFNLIIY